MIVKVYRFSNNSKRGHWFSFNLYKDFYLYQTTPNIVGGSILYEYQITIINPLIIDADGCFPPAYPVKLYELITGNTPDSYWLDRNKNEEKIAIILKEKGYDSVIFKNINCKKYDMVNENGYIDLWLLNDLSAYRSYLR